MIEFVADNNLLLLSYTPEGDPEWVSQKFEKGDPVTLRRSFHLRKEDQHLPESERDQDAFEDDAKYVFVLGKMSGEYFKIKRRIVDTRNAFYFHKSMTLSTHLFVAERSISILAKIDKLVNEDVYIGGTRENAMPEGAYLELVDKLPNSYEMMRYASARVGACLRDYFESASDTERLYQKYMNKKGNSPGSRIISVFRENELAKYQMLLEKLKAMLANESSYCEKQWQDEILDIIRLLYPKYIKAFKNVHVMDPSGNNRYIDIVLVDSCGNIDIIEIKRPFDNCIVSKRQYRDNFIPMKELSGTIMQLEKYILYLNKWGQRGEDRLSERYKDDLPDGLRLKILNPRGIIIMGREDRLSTSQRDDFEIIKRKYKSVIDIVTYDDLLARLGFTISQLQTDIASPHWH